MQSQLELAKAVRHNCDVSDAWHAGSFSICGLALRLRDLYKWEHGLEPWVENDPAEILQWIEGRENLWEMLADDELVNLTLNGIDYHPFDTDAINATLNSQHLLYGALYAQRLKPMFFLGNIEAHRMVNGLPVIVVGRELARDLMTVPAINLDGSIIVRKTAARFHLWDQIVYIKKSGRPALNFALAQLGVQSSRTEALRSILPRVLEAQMETYVYHEIGEVRQESFDRDQWRQIIAAHPQTTVELLARASKDLLADTHPNGPLHHIIQTRNKTGLALYTAFCDGLLRELFPEIRRAFAAFTENSNWNLIAEAVASGHQSGQRWAEIVIHYHRQGHERGDEGWARGKIENRLKKQLSSNKAQSGSDA